MAKSPLPAIVEDDIRGAVLLLVSRDASNEADHDLFCSDRLPIFWDNVPLDRSEPEFAGDAENGRPARSMRCAKVANGDTQDVFESGIAVCELLANASG